MSERDFDADDLPAHGATNSTGGNHPSDIRRREHEARGIPVMHPAPEKSADEHMAEAKREHAERKERHERTR